MCWIKQSKNAFIRACPKKIFYFWKPLISWPLRQLRFKALSFLTLKRFPLHSRRIICTVVTPVVAELHYDMQRIVRVITFQFPSCLPTFIPIPNSKPDRSQLKLRTLPEPLQFLARYSVISSQQFICQIKWNPVKKKSNKLKPFPFIWIYRRNWFAKKLVSDENADPAEWSRTYSN